MKRSILTTIILLALPGMLLAQTDWTNKRRVLPDKLRDLPVGVLLWHDPNPRYPELVGDTYYWKHSTFAMAPKEDLTVVSCGSFIWYDESGWHSNMNYTPAEFAEAFNCPNVVLKKGKTFTYLKNWRFGKQLYGGDALWYIIAKDKNGKLYKGLALIETETNVINAK